MNHYLCTKTRGTNTIHYFIQGKVYSAYPGKEPKYMVFTDEYGDKHPIEVGNLEENFKEVHVKEKQDITLADKQAFVQEKIRGYKKLRATGAFTPQGIARANRTIEVGEALLKDLQQPEYEPPMKEEPVKEQILSVEEYEGMMGQLDQLKHTGQLKQIGHTQVRAMITELYKRQGK